MSSIFRKLKKGWNILSYRLRTQGLKTTLIWVTGVACQN